LGFSENTASKFHRSSVETLWLGVVDLIFIILCGKFIRNTVYHILLESSSFVEDITKTFGSFFPGHDVDYEIVININIRLLSK